jgi:hypothetical protein
MFVAWNTNENSFCAQHLSSAGTYTSGIVEEITRMYGIIIHTQAVIFSILLKYMK